VDSEIFEATGFVLKKDLIEGAAVADVVDADGMRADVSAVVAIFAVEAVDELLSFRFLGLDSD
jgi:hypothetical protein